MSLAGLALSALLFVCTLVLYEASRLAQRKTRLVILNPLLVTFLVMGLSLRLAHIDMTIYQGATRPLSLLIGPSVVALAVPLDARIPELRQRLRAVAISLFAGAFTGVISVMVIARVLGAPRVVILSLAPKSATTAMAVPVAERLGALPSLTAVVVVLVGVLGALIGPSLLRFLGVRDRYAFGLAMGAAAHVVGTARAREEGPVEEAASAAAMALHGLLTVVLATLLGRLL